MWQEINKQAQQNNQLTIIGPMAIEYSAFVNRGPIVYLDGGYNHQQYLNQQNYHWIGDGDSLSPQQLPVNKIKLNPKKDASDLACLLNQLHFDADFNLYCYGLWGGRIDHCLANLGELYQFLKKTHQMATINFYPGPQQTQRLQLYSSQKFECTYKGTFSLFTLEKSIISIHGDCQYPLSTPHKLNPLSSLGLSNHGHGTIQIDSDKPFMLWFEDDKFCRSR